MSADERNAELARQRKLHRREPGQGLEKALFIVVPKNEAEYQIRVQQASYYFHSGQCKCTSWAVEICYNVEQIVQAVNNHKPVDLLRILAHGDPDGAIVFYPYVDAKGQHGKQQVSWPNIHRKISIRQDFSGFSNVELVQCFSHATPRDYVAERCFGTTATPTTTPANPVTWNVPRVLVDGKDGSVHSGLNPDVLKFTFVEKWLSLQQGQQDLLGEQKLLEAALEHFNAKH